MLKYVIMRGMQTVGGDVHEIPFIFPGIVNHDDFLRFRRFKHLQDIEIVSAGFVSFSDDGIAYCEGRSESLRMASRGEIDAAIINKANNYWHSTIAE